MKPLAQLCDIRALEAAPYEALQPWHGLAQALAAVAATHGSLPAISWLPSADLDVPAVTWSHAELLHKLHQTANLLHSLGVDDEQSVAFLLPAMPAAYLALLGGEMAGRVCPINYLLDSEHIAELLNSVTARVLIALAPCPELDIAAKAHRLRSLCPQLQRVLWVQGDPAHAHSFETLVAAQRGDRLDFERAVGRDTIAACFHTGGTTGAPKLAQHTHGNQLHTAVCAARFYGLQPNDRVLNGFPLFHVAGSFVYGLSALLAGASVVLPTLLGMRNPAFVQRYWSFVQREHVTLLAAVPTVISALLNVDPAGADLGRVRVVYTGGSPLPDQLAATFERRYGIPVRNILGMTECAGVISIEPLAAPRVPGSCGLRLPFTEVRSVDDGVLVVRGPNVGSGYTDPQRNGGSFTADGWLVTGDIGHVDDQGRVFVTGRAKDLIIRSGHNIDPGSIEEALLRHPDVLHAAAVGEPDEYAGEVPVAFVVLRPGSSAGTAALLQAVTPWVAERPAVPKRLTIIDTMPMTAIGKVFKPALREQALRHALSERLAAAGLAESVRLSVQPDGSVVFDAGPAEHDAVARLMAPFALRWRIEAA